MAAEASVNAVRQWGGPVSRALARRQRLEVEWEVRAPPLLADRACSLARSLAGLIMLGV
jgi:hypothetical protein